MNQRDLTLRPVCRRSVGRQAAVARAVGVAVRAASSNAGRLRTTVITRFMTISLSCCPVSSEDSLDPTNRGKGPSCGGLNLCGTPGRRGEIELMKAKAGDRLVLESHSGSPRRVAVITDLLRHDGSPPYWVKWLDNEREGLYYPGPDCRIEAPREEVLR